MTIFKNYTYSWWQIGLFKLALLSLGIVIGVYWKEAFSQYINVFLGIGIVLSLYIISVSFKR